MKEGISIRNSRHMKTCRPFELRYLLAAFLLLSLALGSTGCNSQPTLLELSAQQKQELGDCRSELQSRVHAGTLNEIVDQDGACFDRLDRQEALSSSRIRKNAYIIQQPQTRVLMWMVVGEIRHYCFALTDSLYIITIIRRKSCVIKYIEDYRFGS